MTSATAQLNDTGDHDRPGRLSRVRARLADESGVAVVEFALVCIVVLLILFGITQFGLALNSANDETHLANEAARYAAVNYNPAPSGQTLGSWIKSQADNTIISGGGSVCISFPTNPNTGTSGQIGDPVKVVVSTTINWHPVYEFSKITGGALPASSAVSGTAWMRLEAVPTNYQAGCW